MLKTQGRKEEAFAFLGRCLESEPNSVEVNKDVIAVLHVMGYLKEVNVSLLPRSGGMRVVMRVVG